MNKLHTELSILIKSTTFILQSIPASLHLFSFLWKSQPVQPFWESDNENPELKKNTLNILQFKEPNYKIKSGEKIKSSNENIDYNYLTISESQNKTQGVWSMKVSSLIPINWQPSPSLKPITASPTLSLPRENIIFYNKPDDNHLI